MNQYRKFVIARSADWDICWQASRYTVRWRHPNRLPPASIKVDGGYDYPLSGRSTRVSVAVAAMLTAWTGAKVLEWDRATTQYKKYLSSHRRNAEAAGVEIGQSGLPR